MFRTLGYRDLFAIVKRMAGEGAPTKWGMAFLEHLLKPGVLYIDPFNPRKNSVMIALILKLEN